MVFFSFNVVFFDILFVLINLCKMWCCFFNVFNLILVIVFLFVELKKLDGVKFLICIK